MGTNWTVKILFLAEMRSTLWFGLYQNRNSYRKGVLYGTVVVVIFLVVVIVVITVTALFIILNPPWVTSILRSSLYYSSLYTSLSSSTSSPYYFLLLHLLLRQWKRNLNQNVPSPEEVDREPENVGWQYPNAILQYQDWVYGYGYCDWDSYCDRDWLRFRFHCLSSRRRRRK